MRRLTPFWILILIVALSAIYLPGLSKYVTLKRRETELKREMDRLKSEIARLQEEERLLKTDLTRLEQVVREELGLVKPGEVVLKVVEEEVAGPEIPSGAKPDS